MVTPVDWSKLIENLAHFVQMVVDALAGLIGNTF